MTWPPSTHQDVQDAVTVLQSLPFRLRTGQWWTTPEAPGALGSGANPGAGYLCVTPIVVPSSVTVTGIGCSVVASATGALFRMGIYPDDGNMRPGTLLLDAGTIDGSTTGFKSITISQALTAGIYWLAGVQQGTGAASIAGSSSTIPLPATSAESTNGTGLQGWANNGGTTGALPSSFVPTFDRHGTSGNGAGYRILLQAA